MMCLFDNKLNHRHLNIHHANNGPVTIYCLRGGGFGGFKEDHMVFQGERGTSHLQQSSRGGGGAVKIDSQYRGIIRILQSLVRETGKYNCGETHNQNLPTPFPSPPQAINNARSLTPYIEPDCKPRKKG